ncbi:MAG: DUF2812 domain-containing protein [Alistipes sp.]|nr:DUF2812 domain-containing protein [Alistipes sp.]
MKQQGEIKKVWRYFTIADYEREEQWINEMAREGWNLTAVGLCRYIFRRGMAGEYIYKLDLIERTESDEVKESYFNFLTECNIRIVGEFKDWLFLQKRAADGPFDMKNDTYAKLRTVNKIYSFSVRTLCRLLRIFLLWILLLSWADFVAPHSDFAQVCSDVMTGVGIGCIIALNLFWVPILRKLRRQINKLIDEIGVII